MVSCQAYCATKLQAEVGCRRTGPADLRCATFDFRLEPARLRILSWRWFTDDQCARRDPDTT